MTTRLALPAVLVTLLIPSAALASPVRHAPRHTFGRSTSTNWSGYDVTGSGATDVVGTWTQPTASCSPGENSWSSPWVGIDGDTSNTVEQIGTDTDCSGGAPRYYAWYEMYPKSLVVIPSITVTPGDSYSGEVTATGNGNFALTLTDNTTHATYSTVQSSKRARLASIEWVMEGPSGGTLTNFGSVSFSSATGTVNGQTKSPLGLFANPVADPITMVTSKGATRALPSPIGKDNASFSVAWKSA